MAASPLHEALAGTAPDGPAPAIAVGASLHARPQRSLDAWPPNRWQRAEEDSMTGRMWTESMSRRELLRAPAALGGSAAAVALVQACSTGRGSQPAKTSTGGPAVTISHWDYWVSQTPYIVNEIKLFEAANPGIKIKRTVNATTTYDQLFSLAQRSGNLPDTFITALTIPLNDQAAKGWLQPLNKWATGSWQRQFPPYPCG